MWRSNPSFPFWKVMIMEETESKQALYLVMGGRVTDPRSVTFADPESIHVAGVFSSYDAAVDAWRSNAQRTVDDAEMKYVIVHLHKLLDPGA
jgi:hypothetical protein